MFFAWSCICILAWACICIWLMSVICILRLGRVGWLAWFHICFSIKIYLFLAWSCICYLGRDCICLMLVKYLCVFDCWVELDDWPGGKNSPQHPGLAKGTLGPTPDFLEQIIVFVQKFFCISICLFLYFYLFAKGTLGPTPDFPEQIIVFVQKFFCISICFFVAVSCSWKIVIQTFLKAMKYPNIIYKMEMLYYTGQF